MLSHTKDQPVSFCSCLTATTADRFYRIDRAQVSAASPCTVIAWEGAWLSHLHTDQQAGLALGPHTSHTTDLAFDIPQRDGMTSLAQDQAQHLQVSKEKGRSLGGSTEPWVENYLQGSPVQLVRNRKHSKTGQGTCQLGSSSPVLDTFPNDLGRGAWR